MKVRILLFPTSPGLAPRRGSSHTTPPACTQCHWARIPRAQAGFSGGPPTADGRNTCSRLRYERISAGGESDIAERDWHRRYWSQEQFREMLVTAGFDKITFVLPPGDQATPDAPVFVALARRGPLDNNST